MFHRTVKTVRLDDIEILLCIHVSDTVYRTDEQLSVIRKIQGIDIVQTAAYDLTHPGQTIDRHLKQQDLSI